MVINSNNNNIQLVCQLMHRFEYEGTRTIAFFNTYLVIQSLLFDLNIFILNNLW